MAELAGMRRLESEKPADLVQRYVSIASNQLGVRVQVVESACKQPHLMLADLAEQFGGQTMLCEEIEHRRGPVMAGWVVGGAGEAPRPGAVLHFTSEWVGQCVELAIPAREDRSQLAVPRKAQEAVPLTELAVLVPAADDEGALKTFAL